MKQMIIFFIFFLKSQCYGFDPWLTCFFFKKYIFEISTKFHYNLTDMGSNPTYNIFLAKK